jgi:predicted rRNA methylase YqxC with S4 and FtsJ domains
MHKSIIKKIYDFAIQNNLSPERLTNAPIKEGKNKEYLILLRKNGKNTIKYDQLIKYVKL